MQALAVFIIVVFAFARLPAAEAATGMTAMKYYVGKWSCEARPAGHPQLTFTITDRIDSAIMREWLTVPAQGKLLTREGLTAAVTYDSEKRHYVQTQLHYDASWSVSFAKPWIGDTERWADVASDDGQLGRTEVVRVNRNKYSLKRYPTLTSTKILFAVTCVRSQ